MIVFLLFVIHLNFRKQKSQVIARWSADGKIAEVHPKHLIFSIWATTQHYADFDTQVSAVLADRDATRFEDAEATLLTLILGGLKV